MNNNANGRVDIMGPNVSTKFSMMDKIPLIKHSKLRLMI